MPASQGKGAAEQQTQRRRNVMRQNGLYVKPRENERPLL